MAINPIKDSQRQAERDAIDAAYTAEIVQWFSVLCDTLAMGDDPKFEVALATVRRAREIALAAIEL